MIKTIRVSIAETDSVYVERLWFEYNAALNILRYLMSQDVVLEKHLQKYADSAEVKYTELELVKKDMIKKYKPDVFTENQMMNYTFDFDTESLIFEYKEEK